MSQENVEAVLGMFEHTNARDFPAVMDAYADDIVLVLPGEWRGLGGGTVVGKEAVGEWFGDWFRMFDRDYAFEIEESRDLGDRVFIAATHHGHGRGSGAPINQPMAYIYALRDGAVVRIEIYLGRAEALQAAGLSE